MSLELDGSADKQVLDEIKKHKYNSLLSVAYDISQTAAKGELKDKADDFIRAYYVLERMLFENDIEIGG